jgi:hypothetical protein
LAALSSSSGAPPDPTTIVDSIAVFATETERAFALLLDALGLEWEYEPREFEFPNGDGKCGFRPDFYIPKLDLYVELTLQKIVTKKNRKMRLMGEHYPDVNIVLLGRKQLELFAPSAKV